MRIRIDSQQTMIKMFDKMQPNDTCSNIEYDHSVKTYDSKDSDEHRKEQFAGLQKYYWHVKNILMKYIFE